MYLEHLNLVVKDIPETLEFYRAAFPHWQVRGGGEADWYGIPRNWVHFGDDYQYLTFNDDGDQASRDLTGHQMGLAHFAFVTNNLDQLVERLAEAGYHPTDSGGDTESRRNRYFIDPNGMEVEFVQYLSDIPARRNTYDD